MKPIMAICDREVTFTNKLLAVFQEKADLPFEMHGFTENNILVQFCENHPVALLVISQQDYREELSDCSIGQIFILQEEKEVITEALSGTVGIQKFQSAGSLYRQIMKTYAGQDKVVPFRQQQLEDMEVIGFYSPVHRSLQTSMALTMGQILAEKENTVYMNFECFSGLENMMGCRFGGNLTDLLYYHECAKEKLPYRLESVLYALGNLKLIPPANSYQDLLGITAKTWQDLLQEIGKAGQFKYMLLDLSEQMPALFPLLRMCRKIYTIERSDFAAQAKIANYELILGKEYYQDILSKTQRCNLPTFKQLPRGLEQLGRSELAFFCKDILGKDGF